MISILLMSAGMAPQVFCEPAGVGEHAQVRDIVTLVREAASLIETQGEAAFPEFRKRGSQWLHDEIYIFVEDPQGQVHVNADQPIEGQNILEIKDKGGKPMVRDYINLVHQHVSGETWSHYQWYRPPTEVIAWKSAFIKSVKAPSGKEYLVGSGLYDLPTDKMFVEDTVKNAVQLLEQQGKAAFKTLNDKTSPFQYKDVYVFVLDEKGVQHVDIDPTQIEKNIIDQQDEKGKPVVKDMLALIKEKESGWIEYWWPKPNETAPSKKYSYVHRANVNGETLLVGAGVYLE